MTFVDILMTLILLAIVLMAMAFLKGFFGTLLPYWKVLNPSDYPDDPLNK